MRIRPRAEVICFKENKVLVHYADGGWTVFPGGGIEPHESAVAAAKRECLEEADRVLINCTPAHPPTVQVWPAEYNKTKAWAKDYDGGLTYWMTGSTSQDPLRTEGKRHRDYEEFQWRPVAEVLRELRGELHGAWADDVKVRLSILEAHQKMHAPLKLATPSLRGMA